MFKWQIEWYSPHSTFTQEGRVCFTKWGAQLGSASYNRIARACGYGVRTRVIRRP